MEARIREGKIREAMELFEALRDLATEIIAGKVDILQLSGLSFPPKLLS